MQTHVTQRIRNKPSSLKPWRDIWFRPGVTIGRLAHENPRHGILLIPVVVGFANWPSDWLMGSDLEPLHPLGMYLISYGVAGELLQVFVGAYFLFATGKWLGGKAHLDSLRVVVAWSNVPLLPLSLGTFLVWITPIDESTFEKLGGDLLLFTTTVLILWSFFVFFSGLRVVQVFEFGRALWNGLLAFVFYLILTAPLHIFLWIEVFTQ